MARPLATSREPGGIGDVGALGNGTIGAVKILITGSSGYLGRWAVQTALERGFEVIGFDKNSFGLEHDSFQERIGDITDAESARAAAMGCDAVFHLAAALAQFEPDEERMHQVNLTGTGNLLSAALDHQVRKFIFMSSVEVYGIEAPVPCREDAPLNPVSRYGLDKVEGEDLCREYLDKGMDITVFRPPTINGPGQNEPFLLAQIKAISNGKATILPGGGRTRLQMVDVRDVCQAMFLALESPDSKGAVMNLGSDDVPTLREVTLALYDHAGTKPRLISVNATVARIAVRGLSAIKLSPLEPQHLEIALRDHLFDNGLAKKVLKWSPRKSDIESAIDAYEWVVSGGLA
jgi:nucleoside-diphosphate-sugar epimerase